MQYYLELNPGISDVYFESSAFAYASDQLDKVEKDLGLKSHFDFFSFEAQNDIIPEEHQETETLWFEPQAGIEWLETLSSHIRAHPDCISDSAALLSDFSDCLEVLKQAKSEGSQWHFAMDI